MTQPFHGTQLNLGKRITGTEKSVLSRIPAKEKKYRIEKIRREVLKKVAMAALGKCSGMLKNLPSVRSQKEINGGWSIGCLGWKAQGEDRTKVKNLALKG